MFVLSLCIASKEPKNQGTEREVGWVAVAGIMLQMIEIFFPQIHLIFDSVDFYSIKCSYLNVKVIRKCIEMLLKASIKMVT